MARWGREPWAERVQLVVQMLASDLALGDQAAAVADGIQQGIEGSALGRAATTLAGERDKGGAVAVVVLKATRAQLGARGLGL